MSAEALAEAEASAEVEALAKVGMWPQTSAIDTDVALQDLTPNPSVNLPTLPADAVLEKERCSRVACHSCVPIFQTLSEFPPLKKGGMGGFSESAP